MEAGPEVGGYEQRLADRVFAPLQHSSRGFYIFVGVLLVIIAWGLVAYAIQLREGLIVTGLRDRVTWGLYIGLFLYFVGVSVGGRFVSAMLRATKTGWRAPITRIGEIVAVGALSVEGYFIIIDTRHDPHETLFKLIFYGRWESPVTWDIYAVMTYFMGTVLYMYIAMVPDLAYYRDRLDPVTSATRRWVYDLLSMGWVGNKAQKKYHKIMLTLMVIVIIPVAVAVITVTSWLFVMTLREPWDSAMFGVFFLGGGILAGVAMIIIVMYVARQIYHLEEFITYEHFRNMGYVLASSVVVILYFNINQFVTHAYKVKSGISVYLEEIFTGSMGPIYWGYLVIGIAVPVILIVLPWTRNIRGIVVAAALVTIGRLLEAYILVVGGLKTPLNPYEVPGYTPTFVEYSVVAAGIAIFILVITISLKLFPVLTVWEMIEMHEKSTHTSDVKAGTWVPNVQPAGGAD